ncbi:MAG: ORF6N domain-containing protein [Lentisphaerae bacterium]|nr:ORF6N domain-containing protein [Lentisphaerota bacterium]
MPMKEPLSIIPLNNIRALIYTVRGEQVMLDRDLANIYGVENKRLNEQVKRNIERFPESFRFQLSDAEKAELVANCDRFGSLKHATSNPYAFTEQGVSMLSAVLRSESAVKVSIQIMQAFVAMRRFLVDNGGLIQRMDSLEKRQAVQEIQTDERFEEVFKALEARRTVPAQGVFFDGQIFDAYRFANDLLRQATNSIVLIDNYVDDTVLEQLAKRRKGVRAVILIRKISKDFAQDLDKHNAQYPPVIVREFDRSHDRFLILDGEAVYHLGASLKDLGKKWFAFSKLDRSALALMERVHAILKEELPA